MGAIGIVVAVVTDLLGYMSGTGEAQEDIGIVGSEVGV